MTTIGIACGQLQSILKFRSSLFKGLAGYGAAAPEKPLAGCGAAAPRKTLSEVRGGSPEKKLTALSFGLNGLGLVGRSACYMEVFILGAEVLIHEATF